MFRLRTLFVPLFLLCAGRLGIMLGAYGGQVYYDRVVLAEAVREYGTVRPEGLSAGVLGAAPWLLHALGRRRAAG